MKNISLANETFGPVNGEYYNHNSIVHKTNSLIKTGFDDGEEELPDGKSQNLKGPEISLKVGHSFNNIFAFTGVILALYQESYMDPTSEHYWKGRPSSLLLGIGLRL